MKIFILSFALATAAAPAAQAGIIDSHLRNIQDRVRACSILPYTKKDNHRVYHNLISHCPEVKLLAAHKAVIKIAGTTFQARLIETEYSDGDVFDLEIREPRTNDRYRIFNVLAFGDVLLGLLGGETRGLRQTFMPAPVGR